MSNVAPRSTPRVVVYVVVPSVLVMVDVQSSILFEVVNSADPKEEKAVRTVMVNFINLNSNE